MTVPVTSQDSPGDDARITRTQLGNIVGALRAYGKPQAGDDSPNPILGTAPAPDGGTIRVYRDGMLDAIDGSFYSLSPGFSDVDELVSWIEAADTHRALAADQPLARCPKCRMLVHAPDAWCSAEAVR